MRRIWLALLLALCCLLCMACASGETKQLVTADGLTQEAAREYPAACGVVQL